MRWFLIAWLAHQQQIIPFPLTSEPIQSNLCERISGCWTVSQIMKCLVYMLFQYQALIWSFTLGRACSTCIPFFVRFCPYLLFAASETSVGWADFQTWTRMALLIFYLFWSSLLIFLRQLMIGEKTQTTTLPISTLDNHSRSLLF